MKDLLKIYNLLVEIIKIIKIRYKAKSPKFFKKLKLIAIWIGGTAFAIISANATMDLGLDVNWLSYVIAVCVGISGTSDLTRE